MNQVIYFIIILLTFNNAIFASEQAKKAGLKYYSNVFFNAFSDRSYSINFSKGYGRNSNIHDVTDEDFQYDPEYYTFKNSNFHTTDVDAYYSIKFLEKMTLTSYFEFSDKLHTRKDINYLDERSFSPSLDLDFNLNDKHKISLLFQFTHERERLTARERFSAYSNSLQYTPSYSLSFLDGYSVSAETHLKKNNYSNLPDDFEHGSKIILTGNQYHVLLHPSISIGRNHVNETDEDIPDSTEKFLSISNYYYPFDCFNGSITFDYSKRKNPDQAYSYSHRGFTFYNTLTLPFLNQLSTNLNYSINHYKLDTSQRKKIEEWIVSLTLTFS